MTDDCRTDTDMVAEICRRAYELLPDVLRGHLKDGASLPPVSRLIDEKLLPVPFVGYLEEAAAQAISERPSAFSEKAKGLVLSRIYHSLDVAYMIACGHIATKYFYTEKGAAWAQRQADPEIAVFEDLVEGVDLNATDEE